MEGGWEVVGAVGAKMLVDVAGVRKFINIGTLGVWARKVIVWAYAVGLGSLLLLALDEPINMTCTSNTTSFHSSKLYSNPPNITF